MDEANDPEKDDLTGAQRDETEADVPPEKGGVSVDDGPNSADAAETTDENPNLNRRDYLRLGAAAVAVSSTGLVGSVAGATERYGISFDTVVDAVDDLGMDPNGNDPIDGKLENTLSKGNVLIEFPPGEYYFDSTNTFGSPNNWGIRGLGDTPGDVRFRTAAGEGKFFLKTNGGSGQLVENVTLDYSSAHDGSLGMVLRGPDAIRVQDVHYVGFNPTDAAGAVNNLVPMATDPNGTAIIDGVERTGPTDIVSHGHLDGTSNEGPVWLGGRHEGAIHFRNCHFANTGTNAVYASRTPGSVHYDSCLFENNNQASIRIGGGGGDQNTIRDCTFLIDTENAHQDIGGEYINPHGVICETKRVTPGPILVENCEFMYKSGPDRGRLLFVDGNVGPIEVRNSRVRSEVSAVNAVFARTDPRWGDPAPDQSIDIIDSQFSGAGELEVVGGRPAMMDGGCLSAPVSGVDVASNVSRDSCAIPDTSAPAESTEDTTTTTEEDTTTTLDNQITVTGTGTKTNYVYEVSGTVEATGDVEDWDDVSESSVDAWVTSDGASDTYTYSKGLGSVDFVEGEAEVSVNGVQVDPATLSADSAYPNTLQIVGNGTKTNYVASVSGEIADHPAFGTSLSQYDTVDSGTVDGWVTDEMDGLQFSGQLESLEFVEGGTNVLLNGTQIDPTNYDGSTTEPTLTVTTDGVSGVGSTSATFSGTLAELGGASSADVAFEYRPVGGSWTATSGQTLSAAESFTASVSGLSGGTDYEFRATAAASDGDTAIGGTKTFTSGEATTDSAPTINRFNVSEAGRKDPHAEITVNWDVSDVDDDLDTVSLDILDDSGSTVRSTSWTFNGVAAASDTDEYRFRKGGGVDYTVSITVTDLAGNSVSSKKVVSS
ncbi:hypothetical protein ACFQJ5_11570 [Halomicroarcula sp. GCM10025324]|uniref:hypothetical protein n=1 Tax=Haloarcula TaxID=2237 RepID=UPI0023E8296D|nr:hypothetical protein [Halomicroarcula sp. ZS-22-S1]